MIAPAELIHAEAVDLGVARTGPGHDRYTLVRDFDDIASVGQIVGAVFCGVANYERRALHRGAVTLVFENCDAIVARLGYSRAFNRILGGRSRVHFAMALALLGHYADTVCHFRFAFFIYYTAIIAQVNRKVKDSFESIFPYDSRALMAFRSRPCRRHQTRSCSPDTYPQLRRVISSA